MKNKKSNSKGFTLLELLVVVLIIGILAAIALPQYQLVMDKAKVSELFTIVKYLKEEQELFYLTHGRYATNCNELDPELPIDTRKLISKGNYYVYVHCLNEGTRVSSSIRNKETAGASDFLVAIEMYLNNLNNIALEGKEGKSFCFSKNNGRGLSLCKSLGKDLRDDHSYWL